MSNETVDSAFSAGFAVALTLAAGIATIVVCIVNHESHESGYIEACKDFYDGKLKYELKEFPGGEHKWVKIKTN